MKAGFGETDITPTRPACMPGYFQPRWSTDVLHPLKARAAVFEHEGQRTALLVLDLLRVSAGLVAEIRRRCSFDGYLSVTAIHTHTSPLTDGDFLGEKPDEEYVSERLIPGACSAIAQATDNLQPGVLGFGSVSERGLAFCRRYYRDDGTVVTNPPVGAPGIGKPECEPDHKVSVLSWDTDGQIAGLIVHASNHCDSTGGTELGADWPGFMAKELADLLGAEIPVLFLPGTQGDINHLDPAIPHETSPRMAQHLGHEYAQLVAQTYAKRRPLEPVSLQTHHSVCTYRRRHVDDETLAQARATLAGAEQTTDTRPLTSEDLAKGNPAVEALFARKVVTVHELEKTHPDIPVEVGLVDLGAVRILFLPFETFTDLGRLLTRDHEEAPVLVTSLSNNGLGYLAPPECYARGGYETRISTWCPFDGSAVPELKKQVDALFA